MRIREERLRTKEGKVFGWVVDDFVSEEICNKLIQLGKPKLKPSTTLEPSVIDYRTSSNTFLHYNRNMPSVDEVAKSVTEVIQMPLENCEGMQIVHYNPGEFYKPHHDYLYSGTGYWEKEIARGGQRVWTAFLYLNDVESGGETFFPRINFEVKPKTGTMIFWLNLLNGKLNEDSYHEAKPPISCEKWGANIWVREGVFT